MILVRMMLLVVGVSLASVGVQANVASAWTIGVVSGVLSGVCLGLFCLALEKPS